WTEIFLAYCILLGVVGVTLALETMSPWLGAVSFIPGALILAYIVHFLALHQHAAAHNNLAADPALNDRLANVFLAALLASRIEAYRQVHMRHHLWHGTPKYPETAYAEDPDWRFFARWLTGMGTAQNLWQGPPQSADGMSEAAAGGDSHLRFRLLGLAVHAG